MHTDNALRRNAFSSSVNEAIREKVSSFLLESESNCLCFRNHFEDADTALHLMPNILWSVNRSPTVMYYLMKNIIVNTLTTSSEVPEPSLSDSVFSCDEDTKDDKVPDIVHLIV